MSSVPPPNEELAELANVLGEDNAKTLVRTFLREFPISFRGLSAPERKERHRIAHSLKGNSRLIGAHRLSQRLAALEARLEDPAGLDVTAKDLTEITAEYEAVAGALRAYVG